MSRMRGAATAALGLLLAALPTLAQEAPPLPPAPSPTSAAERLASWDQHERMRLESPWRNMRWQPLGPRMQGGRVEAIAVDPRDDATIWVGAGAGNLWRTDNAGVTWRPVFDRQPTFTIGDIALAPSNPDVVYVGTGEVLMARSSFSGMGVFRSDDGGDSWRHLGLAATHHIARVLVHPDDPDTVWVAAIGHLFSSNPERGVYRSDDGGATWQRTLFVDESTGAIDLVADPTDPDVLYAAMWERSRRAWGHTASGPGSGIYRSEDGGRTWRQMRGGFPDHDRVGRVALAVAPSRPSTLYALVDDHTELPPDEDGRRPPRGRVYRSDDAGDSWREVSEQNIPAGYDFCIIAVDPDDPETVMVPGQVFWISEDGGATFRELGGRVVHLLDHDARVLHLDQHELWIDPADGDHMIVGNDGGVYVTRDRGANWLHLNNLPLAEFYAIDLDDAAPFNVWGGTQDDAALWGPSTARLVDGEEDPWRHVYIDRWGGGDSYFTYPHPLEPWIVYYEHQFGALRRKDMRNGEVADIRPRPDALRFRDDGPDAAALAGEHYATDDEPGFEIRVNWMTPFVISRFEPDTLYYGAQFLMKSTDRGATWTAISPVLTSDPGPERAGNIPFGTLTMVSESPLRSGLIWTGSDDGRVWVTPDDGASWRDVTGPFEGLWVSRVEASRHHPHRAWVTLTGYREDDWRPRVWVTDDRGESWRSVAAGLPAEPVNVIAEDPFSADIVYVGTDLGVYVSRDGAASWESLVADLPTTPVHDLAVHPRTGELVVGTHGRGAFLLDPDPLRATDAGVEASALHLFETPPAVAPRPDGSPGAWREGSTMSRAVFRYWLAEPAEQVLVQVLDPNGEVVHTAAGSGGPGVNVLEWDLLPAGEALPLGSFDRWPTYSRPGTYTVRVQAGAERVEGVLVILGS